MYWPEEVVEAISYVQEDIRQPVWVIGVRALYSQGVPMYRATEDVDVYASLDKSSTEKLTRHLTKKYGKVSARWTRFGVSYVFPSGY